MADVFTPMLLAAALATNAAAAPVSTIDPASGFAVPTRLPEDPVERAYRQVLELDDAAQEDFDRWIQEADALGAAVDSAALQKRIQERVEQISKAYGDFLDKHPGHVNGRIAFGSFLNETGREQAAREQWEKARELDPKNPAIYNNLAGIYGHRGPVTNAFIYYEKAIELDPTEPVYVHNLATTVFLFRPDVMQHYSITNEQEVFDKALALYEKALALDPANFILACDLAQTYYLITPPRHDQALAAWRRAYDLASDDLEREGVRIHQARIHIQAGRFEEAQTHLDQVRQPQLDTLKQRVGRTLERKEQASRTNAIQESPSAPSRSP